LTVTAQVLTRNGRAPERIGANQTPHLAKVQNPKDVHFNNDGYELLGKQVAASIELALGKR
jgi:lysophospholipase L1-like esterase